MEEPLALGLLLLPITGGFLLMFWSKRWRFRVNEMEGHKLFFASAAAGTGLLCFARLVIWLGKRLPQSTFLLDSQQFIQELFPVPYSCTLFIAFISGILVAGLSNINISKLEALRRTAGRSNTLLLFLIECLEDNEPIVLFLKNGYFYTGYVTTLQEVSPNPYVRIFPTSLGRKTQSGLITDFFYEANLRMVEEDMFGLPELMVLRGEEILSAERYALLRDELQKGQQHHTEEAGRTQRIEGGSLGEVAWLAVYKWLVQKIARR